MSARAASLARPATRATHAAATGNTSGLTAIAPTIRIELISITPKAAPGQELEHRVGGTRVDLGRQQRMAGSHRGSQGDVARGSAVLEAQPHLLEGSVRAIHPQVEHVPSSPELRGFVVTPIG